MPLTYDGHDERGDLVAFVDVIHGFEAAGGCAAALLVVNQQSEPVEFVFNRTTPGCHRLRLGGLWGSGYAARAEAKILLRSLFDGCVASPAVLVVDEGTVDGRLVALDLRIGIPSAFLREGKTGVVRWMPARPPQEAQRAVDALVERSPLEEVMGRVRSGLGESFRPPDNP